MMTASQLVVTVAVLSLSAEGSLIPFFRQPSAVAHRKIFKAPAPAQEPGNPAAACAPSNPASEKRQKAQAVSDAAKAALDEAAELEREAARLKAVLDALEWRKSAEFPVDLNAMNASSSIGRTGKCQNTYPRANVSSSAEFSEMSEVHTISVDLSAGLAMEEASLRVVWAELGLGPQDAYPLEPISADAIDSLCNTVFGLDSFSVRQVEPTPCGVIFRGSLRVRVVRAPAAVAAILPGVNGPLICSPDSLEFVAHAGFVSQCDSAKASNLIQKRISSNPMLASRLRLFLLADPLPKDREPWNGDDMTFADDDFLDEMQLEPEPVYLAVPASHLPNSFGNASSAIVAPVVSQIVSATILIGWAAFSYVGTSVVDADDGAISLINVWPIVQTALLLQVLHEVAHGTVGLYHRMSISLPFFIPSTSIGLGGGHARLTSFPKNRTQLYDFAVAGPVVGGMCSLVVFLVGLYLTASASDAALADFPLAQASTLHSSLFCSVLIELVLGAPSAAEEAATVALHPMALAGFSGLVANALAMLPIGRLDGGRAATAAYGRRNAAAIGALSSLLLVIACSLSEEPELLLFWTAISVTLFRQAEMPCIDEVTGLSTSRSRFLMPLLLFAVLILCPVPFTGSPSDFNDVARALAQNAQLW